MLKHAIIKMNHGMTNNLMNRALQLLGAVCLASTVAVSPALAAPQETAAPSREIATAQHHDAAMAHAGTAADTAQIGKKKASDCIKKQISRDGRRPSTGIQQTTIGPGILTWYMFANSNAFRYSIFNKNVCVKDRFTVARWDLLATKGISFPASCSRRELVAYAEHCGLVADDRGPHITIRRMDGTPVTNIPRTVKSNNTCRKIIQQLKDECEGAQPRGPNPP